MARLLTPYRFGSPAPAAGALLLLSSSDELDPPATLLLSGDAQSGGDVLRLSGDAT